MFITIIESAKVAYHWKTRQKPTFCWPPVPNKRTHPSSGFWILKISCWYTSMPFYWLFNQNKILVLFKRLIYHYWVKHDWHTSRKPGNIQECFCKLIPNESRCTQRVVSGKFLFTKLSGYHIHTYLCTWDHSKVILGPSEKNEAEMPP
jgi:hypothetical protein